MAASSTAWFNTVCWSISSSGHLNPMFLTQAHLSPSLHVLKRHPMASATICPDGLCAG